ncbi:MAG: hypothetical protein LCH57_09855 [Proteobacteria bacterium]|nr:hypothetical protein [Pseudomonadota bacterium]
MTPEDWKLVEDELRNPYGRGADLRADGHRLGLRVVREKGLKFTIGVYVDGYIRGENSKADSEIGAKFYRRAAIHVFSPAKLRKMAKEHGKRFAARMAKTCPSSHYFQPYWPTVTGLRRHLAKTCATVELVSVGYADKAKPEAAA